MMKRRRNKQRWAARRALIEAERIEREHADVLAERSGRRMARSSVIGGVLFDLAAVAALLDAHLGSLGPGFSVKVTP